RPVTVTAGETAQLDFTLTAAAVSLEGVTVVAATGEEQRAREIPNTVSHIDASKINQEALPTNLADLLNARAPGVQVLPSGGTTGTGSRIRIRGATSVSLTNEPIIVVDGVRVENGPESNSIGVGGQKPSRLKDLNPDVIDTVRSFNPLKVFSPFQTGSRQQYGLSASGGSEATTFFLSGDFEREKGVYHPNDLRRVSLRANVRNQVSRLLDIAVSTGYV